MAHKSSRQSMNEIKQPDLWEAEVHWFHVLTELIKNKTVKNMDATTLKVYLVIKAFANYYDGQSFPNLDTIQEYAGVSENTLTKCIKQLIEIGLVEKKKSGRSNKYELREVVDIHQPGKNEPVAHASFSYVPMVMGKTLETLKSVILKDPNLNPAGGIHIEKLNIFININEPGSQPNINQADYIDQRQKSFPQNVEGTPQD